MLKARFRKKIAKNPDGEVVSTRSDAIIRHSRKKKKHWIKLGVTLPTSRKTCL